MEERIWFKAYVIRDYNLQHSELSKVLYVELINPSGEVVKTEKLKIVDGEADGYIDLNHLLVSGFYDNLPFCNTIESLPQEQNTGRYYLL
jgi:hypothetical protein